MWIDPIMTNLLKSPLHPILSKGMMLVTVTGRKSGNAISTPVAYHRDGNTLWVISRREAKWWRNLRGGADVQVLVAGKSLKGRGSIIEDEEAVAQRLYQNLKTDPSKARFAKVGLDAAGQPIFADCESAAKIMLAVQIDLL